jgi:mono/diheme cytochrome c family protein
MHKLIPAAIIATASLLAPSAAVAADMPGEGIFHHRCLACHAIDHKKVGPAVRDMSKDPAVLKQFITHGKGMMPNFSGKLSPEQIDQVVSYLQSQHGK